ncbi:facilitated trehalose transporter Tret1-like [Oratosquilla oratoria]|uniref:facilitated trehalose transporter Tret1-like n=1 Tax=Oratosquilla oratoria TaxID=337810 RepID=UPI003F761445
MQFVAAGCMMIEGLFMTWPNVVVDLIINANSSVTTESANNLPPSHIQEEFLLTDYEAGWLASLPTLSSIPFTLLSGIFINLVGLKGSTMLGLVLAIVSWLMMGLTPSITALFIGRAISGAAYAFIVTVSQPLVSELVSPKIRGFAASLPRFFSNLASLEINVANIFLPWHLTTTLCAAPFFLLLLSILFVPESPYWLVKKGRENAAISALKSAYPPDYIEVQFQEVKQCVTLKSKKPGVREQIHQMRHPSNYKPVMLMAFIYACYGSNGNSIITPYSTLLFTQAGMTLDPRLCTIILGVVRIAAVIIGSYVTDLCGRRPLYIGSSILSVLSLVSTFVSLTFSFIPKVFVIISLMCFMIFSSGGMNLVPSILLGEVIPSAVQSVGCLLCVTVDCVTYGAFLFLTPWLINAISLRFVFLIPTAINLLGAFIVWKWLPETKGRPLVEIQQADVPVSNGSDDFDSKQTDFALSFVQ